MGWGAGAKELIPLLASTEMLERTGRQEGAAFLLRLDVFTVLTPQYDATEEQCPSMDIGPMWNNVPRSHAVILQRAVNQKCPLAEFRPVFWVCR